MDPFSLSTGVVGLISFALKLVVGALGMIDKTVAAYDEATDELKGLQQDLEQLQTQMIRIHATLKVLASNTKDRGFKKLLRDEYGQAAVRELCNALEETFTMLTLMTDRTNSDDLRPAPLPPNKKSLEFIRAVLKYNFTPSKITDLVKALRDVRSDVQRCLTKLETTFQHVHTLYDIMNNGLARIASRTSIFSTSTNLTVRIKLSDWLKRREEAWGLPNRQKTTPLHEFLQPDEFLQPTPHFLQPDEILQPDRPIGISHMTSHLLGKIFHHLCDKGPLPLRNLLFVSKHFYDATVNDSRLWTTISLDSLFAHHFHQWPEQGNKFVEQCLLRSGSLPLCLYIDYSNLIAYDPTFLLRPLETFGRPEWKGFKRCTSLIWADGGYGATTIQKIVALLPKGLPSLQHISLSFFDDPIDGSQFPDCPVLERVEMETHRQSYPPFWGTNFLHVTTLSFGNYAGWADYDMTTLSQFPVLHDLTLFTEHGRTAPRGVDSQRPINFKQLQILRVHGYIPPEVLIKLIAPALKELHLKANAEHFTSIDSLQNSFNPLCRRIYALLPEAVSAKEPEWATKLSKLVQKCTRIKTLDISRWMEGEYKKFMSDQDGIFLHVQ